ncbi:cell wall hydrolase [Sphingopyxis sp. GC21]|uniref:cell wall hydrolase n=1 Tax=Sphingopyxis sp. GC21 TaxID=2933562 RepID=UPI0021E4F6D9|nr:cell wall hydrolase [Sphingopyxis sp. GC21]
MVRTRTDSGLIRDRLIAALLVLAAVAALAFAAWALLHRGQAARELAERTPVAMARPPVPQPQLYKELAPEDARAENAALPFSTAPIERAPPLVLPINASDVAGRRSSIDCLTAAIYYEAGQESDQGKRGVAQVVLNRVRHPAFPNSICGVVYQGSERPTGCQFTFTCDGSLARIPTRQGWEAARRIAVAALSGAVEPSVGMATHYHADYVVPYWASSLAKIAQLDHHIFYRWTGGWGRRTAFTQSVSQEQPLVDQPQIEAIGEAGFTANGIPPNTSAILKSPRLLADENAGAPLGDASEGVATAPAVSPLAADANRTAPAADATSGRLKGE